MYTLIVVDDEEDIRHGIVSSIDWAGWGFVVVGEAASGVEAVSLIEAHQPDVVLSDIRMPGMDGVELMRYVSQHHPQTMVVVLSGYSDFAYLKSAIKHGVVMYLLKPTDLIEFENTFRALRERLDQRRAEQATLNQSAAFLRDDTLTRHLDAGARPDALPGLLAAAGLPQTLVGCRVAMIAPRYTPAWFAEDRRQAVMQRRLMASLLGEQLSAASLPGLFFLYRQSMLCGLLMAEEDAIRRLHTQASERIRTQLSVPEWQLGLSGTIGPGGALLQLHAARAALSPTDVPGSEDPVEPTAHTLSLLLSGKDATGLQRLLTGFAAQLARTSATDFDAMDNAFMKLLFMLEDAARGNGLDLPPLLTAKGYAYDTVRSIESLQGKACFVQFAMDRLLQEMDTASGLSANERLAAEIMRILQRDFSSHQLSLSAVAESVGRSQEHISRVVREVTGQSFVQQIRALRMEKALYLLRNTNQRIYEIAGAVGYPDMSNFMKTFKKHYGMTPVQCRNQQERG